MQRSSALLLIAATLLATPALAADHSRLSPEDQARTVCVPQRDAAGQLTDQQTCMTGRQWEVALQKVRTEQRMAATDRFYRLYPRTNLFPQQRFPQPGSLRPH